MPWVKNCPHRNGQDINIVEEYIDEEDDDNSEKVNIVLVTKKVSDREIFIVEAVMKKVTGEP